MVPMDMRTKLPPDMAEYISMYGFNFNKKACMFAISLMRKKNPSTGEMERIEPLQKEQVEELLANNGIILKGNKMYNHVFVANMAKADYWKSSIEDERHLALFIRDYIDDADGNNEIPFRRWLASMVAIGEPIDWGDLL